MMFFFLTLLLSLSTLEKSCLVLTRHPEFLSRSTRVTKKDIVRIISEKAELTQTKTKQIVQWTFDEIVDTIIREGRIELRNFGVFEVKTRKPRRARNPRTNEPVEVEAKNVVTFQPGKEMEDRVRKMPKSFFPKRKKRRVTKSNHAYTGVNN